MLAQLPLWIFALMMGFLITEQVRRVSPPHAYVGRHRTSTAPGMSGWQTHTGLRDEDTSVFS